MSNNNLETRVKIQQIVESQLPSYILDESPKTVDFLKQYYISQEYQGGPIDITDNLDQYLKLDTLLPDVLNRTTNLNGAIDDEVTTITVDSTKGYPDSWGLFKIGDEIITYESKTTTTFENCVRGFVGITDYHDDLNKEELVFVNSNAASHADNESVENLSSLFIEEFYKKIKFSIAPGLQEYSLDTGVNPANFLKEIKSLYQTKGTEESFRILYNVLYNETPKIINLEDFLIKSSGAEYRRKEVVFVEAINNENLLNLEGQSIFKDNDLGTSASVSAVESFSRSGKTYYEMSLFVGYNQFSAIEGNFTITPSTKMVSDISENDTIVSVDSTLGFAQSGDIYINNVKISYTDKTINQFIGCTGTKDAKKGDVVRNNEIYFGYDTDLTTKLFFRIIGTLDNEIGTKETYSIEENEEIRVKNLGDLVENQNNNYKQIFANSWIYNASPSFEGTLENGSFLLAESVDRSALKVGDEVELIQRNNKEVLQNTGGSVYVDSIDSNNSVEFSGGNFSNADSSVKYNLRRKVNTAKSTNGLISSGNNTINSDILNVYFDDNSHAYVASNSLPTSKIDSQPGYNYRINITENTTGLSISTSLNLKDENTDGSYNIITVNSNEISRFSSFISGDEVYYQPSGSPLAGLETGSYFIEKIGTQEFKLYSAKAFVGVSDNVTFNVPATGGFGEHNFSLASQKSTQILPAKLLKKLPLQEKIENTPELTKPGTTGMLVNGVEIYNYKSNDKIYYGSLEEVSISSGGNNFDVLNPPLISVAAGVGTNALVQPVVSGSFTDVFVDSQDYDIEKILSVNISGGNGTGAVIEPIITKRHRIVSFDAKSTSSGGGVSLSNDRIRFLTEHNFDNAQEVIYNPKNSTGLSITGGNLESGASYFARVVNTLTIELFNSKEDCLSNTNRIDITAVSTGVHEFRTADFKNTVSDIAIIDGGSGYTNRKLIVSPSGISTFANSVTFENHGFSSGDIVQYETEGTLITGLSTTTKYKVRVFDKDTFKLSDAGSDGLNNTNFDNRDYVSINSTGTGYQIFRYPTITVQIDYQPIGSQTYEALQLTPVVKGSIIDAYLYEKGSGYGSTIVNYSNNPVIQIKNGKDAGLRANIIDGKITSVDVQYGGVEYYSIPELIVTDSSDTPGSGAKLRPIISNGSITEVKIISSGLGYSSDKTTISVKASGENAFLSSKVKSWTVNNNLRFKNSATENKYENLLDDGTSLKYVIGGYKQSIRNYFGENTSISGIIGWAYDGNPIYGPYGFAEPDTPGTVKRLDSGYSLAVNSDSNIRPQQFENGFFQEDYVFNNSGDLDEYNGRFEKNVEFPNGVYAYHAIIDSNGEPQFPYFIGDKYKSKTLEINETLNQNNFDHTIDSIRRNTYPYRILQKGFNYDFIEELENVKNQRITVDSVSSGVISSLEVVDSGQNYKVNDKINFDDENTSGGGVDAIVASLKGKKITNLTTALTEVENCEIVWKDKSSLEVFAKPSHEFTTGDYVNISSISSSSNLNLLGNYQIEVSKNETTSISSITSGAGTTEIFVADIPLDVAIGSSVTIGSEETFEILDIYRDKTILKLGSRSSSSSEHAEYSKVVYNPDRFIIKTNKEYFNSSNNFKLYFNPTQSVGFGTTVGSSTEVEFNLVGSGITITRSIPTQSIYFENHPFVDNQKLTYSKVAAGNNLSVSLDGINTSDLTVDSTVYISNKGKNIIGLREEINGSEYFFHSSGSDNDFYSLETDVSSITGTVKRLNTTINVDSTGPNHDLEVDDIVTLNVSPSQDQTLSTVGIGSTNITLVRNSDGSVGINKFSFVKALSANYLFTGGIGTSHNLKTGDLVFYTSTNPDRAFTDSSNSTSLNNKTLYVYRDTDTRFYFCHTYEDAIKSPPEIISLGTVGIIGPNPNHSVSLVNPKINVTKNNNLTFDLSDSSVLNYNLKFFRDKEFNDEYVSSGSSDDFLVNSGTISNGSAGAATTITYNNSLPKFLYYTLEKEGVLSETNVDVVNGSTIEYTESLYNTNYKVVSKTDKTFNIVLKVEPEKLSYSDTDCDTLEYTTTSKNASGPIHKTRVLSGGSGYKKLPKFEDITSTNGNGGFVVPKTNNIGEIKKANVVNKKFQYPFDSTITPSANISPQITVKNANVLKGVNITSGGSNYATAPDLIIVNTEDSSIVDSGFVKATVSNGSISEVSIESEPKGLPEELVKIVATNNDNGVNIVRVESSSSGIFTCLLPLPKLNQPDWFEIGDEVYIEGIEKLESSGSGFNSEDYEYKFLTINNYIDNQGNYHRVEFNLNTGIGNTGLTSNTGIAKTVQDSTGTMILKNSYPVFTVETDRADYLRGESLLVNNINTDLVVSLFDGSALKVQGTYELKVNDKLKGVDSGSESTVRSIESKKGVLNVNYSVLDEGGWNTDTGKLNKDYQVTADNDYYQNLSYSVKSNQTIDNSQSLVKGVLHTSGLKDFYDTQIIKEADPITVNVINVTSNITDIIEVERVDIEYDFDKAFDTDVSGSTSKFIKFQNQKLSDYTEGQGNTVLSIDDISNEFASEDLDTNSYTDIFDISSNNISAYDSLLVKVENEEQTQIQFTDLVILKNNQNEVFLSQKSNIVNSDDITLFSDDNEIYGNFTIRSDIDDNKFITFEPTSENKFDQNYQIKILKNTFANTITGSGNTDIGNNRLLNKNLIVNSNSTGNIFSITNGESLFVNAHIIDNATNEMNFVEMYVTKIGSDVYMSEYYHDGNSIRGTSGNPVGILTATGDANTINLNYSHETSSTHTVRAKGIAFSDSQFSATDIYRFKTSRQPDGSERSLIYKSDRTTSITGAGPHTIASFDKTLFNAVKCIVEVHDTTSNRKALHQLTYIHENNAVTNNTYIQQHQILSVSGDFSTEYSDVEGLGYFDADRSGDFILRFHPDNTSNTYEVTAFSQAFYNGIDDKNDAPNLEYGELTESVYNRQFVFEGKQEFGLTTDGIPIFAKTFDPEDTEILNASTGTFSIANHFFRTGQELNYTPGSTVIGITSTAMTFQRGSVTDTLPSTVYAVVTNEDSFQIATTREDAFLSSPGTVTFSNLGSGNAHQFEMADRDSKCVISVDGLIQQPLILTGVSHTTSESVTATDTFIKLSGISSVRTLDVLKIDDEYVRVDNVGFATDSVGPITGIGTTALVSVTRGFVGSTASTHTSNTNVDIYRGSFRIFDNNIQFTEPPRGTFEGGDNRDDGNKLLPKSQFNGRVYLRSEDPDGNYENRIYDDLSNDFTGIAKTFTLTVGGANTTGIGTLGGSGLVMINGMFQQPTTDNNPNGNYQIVEDTVAGITSIVFSEIRTPDTNEFIEADYDINKKELPRGGAIVSLGSTTGRGFAPLRGAKVLVETTSGEITDIIGIPTTGSSIGIDTASYNNLNGEMKITTLTDHGFVAGDPDIFARISGLAFTCAYNPGITSYFPEKASLADLSDAQNNNNEFPIVSVESNTEFTINVGVSTREHTYTGGGTLNPWYQTLNFGSGYFGNVGVALTNVGDGSGSIITASVGAGGTLRFAIDNSGSNDNYATTTELEIPQPSYSNLPIVGVSRVGLGTTTTTGIGFSMNVKVGPSAGSTYFEVTEFEITKPGYAFQKGDVFKPVGLVTDASLSEPISDFELTVIETYTDSFAAWEFGELDFIDSIRPYQDGRNRFPLFYNGNLLSFEKDDESRIDYNNVLLVFVNGVIQVPGESYTFDGGTSFVMNEAPKSTDNVSIYFYKGIASLDIELATGIKPTLKIGDELRFGSGDNVSAQTQNRTIYDISTSDTVETNLYSGVGINTVQPRSLHWIKQKEDKLINNVQINKVRKDLEPLILPRSYVIKNVTTSETSEIFVDSIAGFGTALDWSSDSNNHTFTRNDEPMSILIIDDSESLAGIATSTGNYSSKVEIVSNITGGTGRSGIVTGITYVDGTNVTFGLDDVTNLAQGYPIYIYDTFSGDGSTSLDTDGSTVVGLGTTYMDNIYIVDTVDINSNEIGVRVQGTIGAGINTTNTNGVGNFSWGRLTGTMGRSTSPLNIVTFGRNTTGLSTHPIVERRNVGIRSTGALSSGDESAEV